MNKVITINLGGTAFQLEDAGYDALRTYLDNASARLQGNPDRDEILSDIEGAIAEKFRELLASHKNVILTQEVSAVLSEMGPIEAGGQDSAEPNATGIGTAPGAGPARGEAPASGGSWSGSPRRLYRIKDGAMIAGVCNGIGAYLHLDPTLVRLGFALLTLIWGTGLLVYIIMVFVVPEAITPEEKAAASGAPFTAQEFIRRAREGYYEAMKNFPDRKTRREWQRRFKREMRANAHRWSWHWPHGYQPRWAETQTAGHPGVPPLSPLGFGLPIFSLLQGTAFVLLLCAFISLVGTGTVLGLPLPGSIPAWSAVLLLLFVYMVLTMPLKLARRSYYYGVGRTGVSWSFVCLADALIWIGVAAVLLCLAVHYSPELGNAIRGFPTLVHQAVDDIRTAWKGN